MLPGENKELTLVNTSCLFVGLLARTPISRDSRSAQRYCIALEHRGIPGVLCIEIFRPLISLSNFTSPKWFPLGMKQIGMLVINPYDTLELSGSVWSCWRACTRASTRADRLMPACTLRSVTNYHSSQYDYGIKEITAHKQPQSSNQEIEHLLKGNYPQATIQRSKPPYSTVFQLSI